MLVYGHDEAVADWVLERIPHVSDFGPCSAIGVASGERLCAGVVFSGYRPDYGNIEVSIASESAHWMRPEIIGEILAYPFMDLGVWCVYATMLRDDEKTIEFNKRLGFAKPVTIGHYFGPGRHAVVTRMLRDTYDKRYGGADG